MDPIQQFLIENIPSHPKDVVKLAMQRFQKTRPGIIYHLNILKDRGMVKQQGLKNNAHYLLTKKAKLSNVFIRIFRYRVGTKAEDEIWKDDVFPILGKDLSQNVLDICQFGLTEMINNVIDHSRSEEFEVEIKIDQQNLIFKIIDLGIGIFKKIATENHYLDFREAALRLQQGKFTSDPTKHSGEGIYFTSRVFDEFMLMSNGIYFDRNNVGESDWFIESQDNINDKGTAVILKIAKQSSREIRKIFDENTNPETHAFNSTHILIKLGQFKEDSFISRSQAKRLFAGLHPSFEQVILDFKNIRSVGQAFIDEIFRVFWQERPTVSFYIRNDNSDIRFMIERCLADTPVLKNYIKFGPVPRT